MPARASPRKVDGRPTSEAKVDGRPTSEAKVDGRPTSEAKVDEGSNACIYSPALACADASEPPAAHAGDPALVSKYGDLASLRREQAVYDVLDRIAASRPGQPPFHLRSYGVCAAAPPARRDCPQAGEGEGGVLTMERGGESLGLLIRRGRLYSAGPVPFSENVRHLVRALAAMADAGVAYTDMHDGNAVMGPDGYLRLIDFESAQLTSPEAARARLGLVLMELQSIVAGALRRMENAAASRAQAAMFGMAADDATDAPAEAELAALRAVVRAWRPEEILAWAGAEQHRAA
jgi:hypothetical protein